MDIALIVAMDDKSGIGKDNKLLCYLPADLKRFKLLTSGHSIIMGRKTFESLPKGALPNRRNIVLTRDNYFHAPNCIVVHSVNEALEDCNKEEKVYIIGGEQIYKLFIKYANYLHITKIHHSFDADAFFPELKDDEWQQDSITMMNRDEKNSFNYSFIDFSRRK